MSTFREYLATRRTGDNAASAFTKQVRDDPAMEGLETWPELRAYIYRTAQAHKLNETLASAEPVWKGYRAYVLKHGRR
jgi:hypothetical protein